MSTKTDSGNTSPDIKNRNMSADTTPDSSSAGAETDHLFPEPESKDASRETAISNPQVDTNSTDTPDSLTLARLDRENQGTWEAEYSYGEEADLHRHYDNCTKNSGHKNFIPVDEFSMEDLPEEYRDKDVLDYIRAVSDLTVRVTVKYVSDKRPETDCVCVSGKSFPGYFHGDQRRTTVGTGWVSHVFVICESEHRTCGCKDCLASSKPQTEFAEIYIYTANHVVYDESEAAHTTCHLYFDRGGTPETCEGVVALNGMSGCYVHQEIDECTMSHCTHDLDLAHRLRLRYAQRLDLLSKIWGKAPNKWKLKWARPAPDKQPLLFIVSHPHGCSKQISIGRWHSLLSQTDVEYSYTYTTHTCPGSSGAAVHLLDNYVRRDCEDRMVFYPSVHRGVCDTQPGMNLSLFDKVSPYTKIVSPKLLLLNETGLSEDICCVKEEDLRKHYDTCQNNPGHQNFFPVDKFSVDHLPPCKCNDEIMELIKVLSELTVRVSVTYVSENRPEAVPDTDIPYPWYRNRGSNQLRVGSGRITFVEFPDVAWCMCEECKNSDTPTDDEVCKCEECKNSDTPTERKYARIYIHTAKHLVYDEMEGKQTTCHLFFDSGETPDACKDVVAVTNAYFTKSRIDLDRCTLAYRTHDLDLAHKLEESVRLYVDLQRQCYSSYNHETVKHNERKNLTANPPLNIVVSHPHGRAKHVSISYPGCHGNTDTEEIQPPYKSITCPGSSGAPVIALDNRPLYLCIE